MFVLFASGNEKGRPDAAGDAVPGGGAVLHFDGQRHGHDGEGGLHHVQGHHVAHPLHLVQVPPPAAHRHAPRNALRPLLFLFFFFFFFFFFLVLSVLCCLWFVLARLKSFFSRFFLASFAYVFLSFTWFDLFYFVFTILLSFT